MTRIWLVVNAASGSFDPAIPDRLKQVATQGGAAIDRVVQFPDEDIPTAAELDKADVHILAVFAGDGTINAAARALAGWDGAILPLPGGTMNLLSRHLHHSRDVSAILLAALGPDAVHRPVTGVADVAGGTDIFGLVGIFAGPTTAWGEVRETMRRGTFAQFVEAVPQAIEQTFEGTQVHLSGSEASYRAIYVEPHGGTLRLMGFTAEGAGDLFAHGFAWLGGDFRKGPHQELGDAPEVEILTLTGEEMGLLVDGERYRSASPLRLRAIRSETRFIATSGPDAAGSAP